MGITVYSYPFLINLVSSEKISLDCTSIQLILIFRKLSDIYYDVQTVLSARFSKGFRFKSLSTNKQLVVITVYEFQIVEAYVCQSFQTLYKASPIINVTHRSFAVFHPIMYVTHRSFVAPAPATRDFFWLYHTYSLLRGGFYNASSGFGLWAKTLRGINFLSKLLYIKDLHMQSMLLKINNETFSPRIAHVLKKKRKSCMYLHHIQKLQPANTCCSTSAGG